MCVPRRIALHSVRRSFAVHDNTLILRAFSSHLFFAARRFYVRRPPLPAQRCGEGRAQFVHNVRSSWVVVTAVGVRPNEDLLQCNRRCRRTRKGKGGDLRANGSSGDTKTTRPHHVRGNTTRLGEPPAPAQEGQDGVCVQILQSDVQQTLFAADTRTQSHADGQLSV